MEGVIDLKYDGEFRAVLVRYCHVTNALETFLFGDVEAAMKYCEVRFKILPSVWESYLVQPDSESSLKLNGQGVRIVGWKFDIDETQTLHIHANKKIVEF